MDKTTEDQTTKKTPEKKDENSIVFFADSKITCACGNSYVTGSTKKEIHVEICSNCHPFFTGQEKFVDTEGRVERFQRMKDAKVETKTKKAAEPKKDDRPKTLKEMLMALEK